MKNIDNLAVVILAAGSSKRLGKAKQLLRYKDETLLKIAVKKALNISLNIFVVLGYEKELCQDELKEFKNLNIIYNPNYKMGIGNSISFAITHTKNFQNTMIILCDQPFIPSIHLQNIKNSIDNSSIICSLYEDSNSLSVPAIFPKKYYPELLKLNEDKGAKAILQKECTTHIFLKKEFCIDIDTIEDIQKYLV